MNMKTFDREYFGKQLKQLRTNRKLNQTQLGEALGVGQTTVSNWEKGFREPENIGEILKIADYFNVPISFLVNEDDNKYGDHQANLEHLASKPELLDIYNDIHESENLQILFDTARDLTPEELEKVLAIIKLIHEENE